MEFVLKLVLCKPRLALKWANGPEKRVHAKEHGKMTKRKPKTKHFMEIGKLSIVYAKE